MKNNSKLLILLIALIVSSCNMGPKSTEPFAVKEIPKRTHSGSDVDVNMHEVIAVEVLPASEYVYIKVKENGKDFWIATRKQKIEIGSSYLYNEALQKIAFESKEHKRVFDTLYLVTALVPKDHGASHLNTDKLKTAPNSSNSVKKPSISPEEMDKLFMGVVTVSDLVENPKKYEGKVVELNGECTKVNNGIMGRNWIHLNDGSKNNYDLVITSENNIEKGAKITMRGIVRLNKDFGAGYSYDIILEEGTLIN